MRIFARLCLSALALALRFLRRVGVWANITMNLATNGNGPNKTHIKWIYYIHISSRLSNYDRRIISARGEGGERRWNAWAGNWLIRKTVDDDCFAQTIFSRQSRKWPLAIRNDLFVLSFSSSDNNLFIAPFLWVSQSANRCVHAHAYSINAGRESNCRRINK